MAAAPEIISRVIFGAVVSRGGPEVAGGAGFLLFEGVVDADWAIPQSTPGNSVELKPRAEQTMTNLRRSSMFIFLLSNFDFETLLSILETELRDYEGFPKGDAQQTAHYTRWQQSGDVRNRFDALIFALLD
jgi:hypothetical protein